MRMLAWARSAAANSVVIASALETCTRVDEAIAALREQASHRTIAQRYVARPLWLFRHRVPWTRSRTGSNGRPGLHQEQVVWVQHGAKSRTVDPLRTCAVLEHCRATIMNTASEDRLVFLSRPACMATNWTGTVNTPTR